MILVNAETMKRLDRKAERSYGIKGIVLMENAGRAVSEAVKREASGASNKRVSIVCGKGNNGGDGFVSARHLKNSGFDVTVFSFSSISGINGDAGINARIWEKMGGVTAVISKSSGVKNSVSTLKHSSVIVDAIFGIGLSKRIEGVYKEMIEAVNKVSKPVVAIDVPSGIDATSGKVLGLAIKASRTVTMAFAKPGLFVYPARDFSGKVEVADIGMPKEILSEDSARFHLLDDSFVASVLRPRKKNTHKGTYGHTLVIGGSIGKTGAPYMAALGAMRAGAGLATIALPKSLDRGMDEKTIEVMTCPLPETTGLMLGDISFSETVKAMKGKTSVVIGPGLGGGDTFGYVRRVVEKCVELDMPLVIDADGLNALSEDVSVLKKASKKGGRIVITPHPGEVARLFGVKAKDVQFDRIGFAQRLFKETGCTVVLKGAGTIVASKEKIFINPTGNPGMASAGTGDVLSGIIGAFLSQGIPDVLAACAAVYIHGLCGDEVAKKRGEIGMLATDILNELPVIINSFVEKSRSRFED
ncbi:MAG: NAD(P)H-hydrate dehydratase [Thermodesulfobacteriota bacterium]